MRRVEYVTFSLWDANSIKSAERRKTKLENMGYVLRHESKGCLMYIKPQEQQQPLNLD